MVISIVGPLLQKFMQIAGCVLGVHMNRVTDSALRVNH
jgi:hypothetical protein